MGNPEPVTATMPPPRNEKEAGAETEETEEAAVKVTCLDGAEVAEAKPFPCTCTLTAWAPPYAAPTVHVMLVDVQFPPVALRTAQGAAPMLTFDSCTLKLARGSRPSPVMVTTVPRAPEDGLTEEMSGVFYSRGLVISMILGEGIRVAQEHAGTPEITSADLRWGLENLDITEARLEELGMTGMVPPFKTSCANHTGHSGGWILEWDGAKFVKATDLIMPDAEAIAPLEAQAAKDYAEANAPWPANDACQM